MRTGQPSTSGGTPVVTAIVLIKAEIQRIPEVAEVIAQIPAVSEVYSVTGDFDMVAIVRVRAHDELADVIPGGLNKVPGVIATQTHIAFRTYSRHDLDAAFAIGLADA
jgi:DNA-binding Lrp family transcriptional regulator